MARAYVLLLAGIMLLALAIPSAIAAETCHTSVKTIPATCTKTITSDTSSGNCRTILCGSGTDTIKVLACDKPDSGTKLYFEMYKQSATGATPKVCIGETCIQGEGYKKSANFPICTETTTPPPTNTSSGTPDLVVKSMSGPSSGTTGSATSISAEFANQGTGTAQAGWIARYYLSKDTTITKSDAFIGEEIINVDAPAGWTKTQFSGFTIPWNMPEGNYYWGIIIDELNNVPESNEQNNVFTGQPFAVLVQNTCQQGVMNLPAYCNGGRLIQDQRVDGCVHVTCEAKSGGRISASACDRPSETNPAYFDVVRTAVSSGAPEFCIGGACVSSSAQYARSADYPACTQSAASSLNEAFSDNNYNANPAWQETRAPHGTTLLDASSGAMHVERTNSGGFGEGSGVTVDTNIPVTDKTAIEFDVKVDYSSVRNQCGDRCTEFPANVIVKVRKTDGSEVSIYYAYNNDGGFSHTTTEGIFVSKGDAPTNTWLRDQQHNIRATVPNAQAITSVTLMGIGWDFGGWYDNVRVFEQAPASASIEIDSYVSKDHNVVARCVVNGFTPSEFRWNWGDGTTSVKNKDTVDSTNNWEYYYHVYQQSGTYTISCNAVNGSQVASASKTVTITTQATPQEIAAVTPADYTNYFNPYVFRSATKQISGATYDIGGYAIGLPRNADNTGQYGYWAYTLPFYPYYTSTHDSILRVTFPQPGSYGFWAEAGINNDRLTPEEYTSGIPKRGCSNPRTTCMSASGGQQSVTVPDLGTRTVFGFETKKVSSLTYDIRCVSYISDAGGSSSLSLGDGNWATTEPNEWARHTYAQEGSYSLECSQDTGAGYARYYTTINATAGGAASSDPGEQSSLTIAPSTMAGKSISASSRSITVSPGQQITGTINLNYDNAWTTNTVLAVTPSWGTASTAFKSLGSISSGTGSRSVGMTINAPTAPGTYKVIFAYRAEVDAGDVMSMTNWAANPEKWGDGNDIASWTSSQVSSANANGRAQGMLYTGSGYGTVMVPATSFEIVVQSTTSSGACYSSVKDAPVTCTGGSVTTDTFDGSCRKVICTASGSSMQALACNKGTFFEAYKQSQTGTAVSKICYGTTCVGNAGYAKSTTYPICS